MSNDKVSHESVLSVSHLELRGHFIFSILLLPEITKVTIFASRNTTLQRWAVEVINA